MSLEMIACVVQVSWNCNFWQGIPNCCNQLGIDTQCRQGICGCCVRDSNHSYVNPPSAKNPNGEAWGAEWWDFPIDSSSPNLFNGRVYGSAPFGYRKPTEEYITKAQGTGLIFFLSTDLHDCGRKIVGVYGNASIHGIDNRCSSHGKYSLRKPLPRDDEWTLIFEKHPPPPSLENILIDPPDSWYAPNISGEIELSTHFEHPLNATDYDDVLKLESHSRSRTTFPIIISDHSRIRDMLQHALSSNQDHPPISNKIKKIVGDE